MAIASGQRITAALLRRLRTAYYTASSTSELTGAVTQGEVPGASVTFTTETAARWFCEAVFDADQQGTNTALMLGYCDVDGTVQAGQAINSDPAASDRHTVSQMWDGTLSAAGTHTIKLLGTLAASQAIRVGNTRLKVTIQEAV
ncbi:hypothetical protein E1211_15205 [Micromonospora sp. 15K316]|uniref:hypothetical protein n=1 Tax=unclassified Micromonospora TaxID=2617518 RepID=UPI00104963B8|nr:MULTISPECIES: hypothetical protein [unclassified Micromonospora]TDB71807.1 hypothetical protein E1165_22020 [Micromonospora sp. KC723]TDC35654.1 hypothetical protein E1211_15205 [Micromonospora sp. 15K316]